MKYIIWLIAALICADASAQQNISYFRNDGKFTQVKISDQTEITHEISESGVPEIKASDWIDGDVSIPLTSIDSIVLKQSDIPVLRFTFPDYPDIDGLKEKELYLSANLDIEGNGHSDDVSGLTLKVKGRGNSTWGMPKKPMRLKFSKKTSICGMRKSKNYVLLNNYVDPTLMRNALALWLAKELDVPYANTIVPCHVFINGHYAGAYTLTEKIGINSTSVDIDENIGILFEISTEFDEKYQFKSNRLELPVMVKAPDFDELYDNDPCSLTPTERLDLWKTDYNNAENLACQGMGSQVFDIESAVNYVLLYNIVNNCEIGFPKSLYVHKKSLEKSEKYYFGPAWDFDVAYNFSQPSGDSFIQFSPESRLWLPQILNVLTKTSEFKTLYTERLNKFEEEIFPNLLNYFDQYSSMIEASAKYEGIRWPDTGKLPGQGWAYRLSPYDHATHVAQLREWLIARAAYLKNLGCSF